ncbi:hypothetical protein Leryth_013700 [Lithospermum erythrorhizon]|nr:hypothetical protein Leryth_013700 [Lithospermum erythrorhizon]
MGNKLVFSNGYMFFVCHLRSTLLLSIFAPPPQLLHPFPDKEKGSMSYLWADLFPSLQDLPQMQKDKSLEHENGDTFDASNFVDLDWLSSSGTLCEEDILERSMLINSPVTGFSSENVLNEVREASTSTSEYGTKTFGGSTSVIEKGKETGMISSIG